MKVHALLWSSLVLAKVDFSNSNNLGYYWGQNGLGQEDSQKPLSHYCKHNSAGIVYISFLTTFDRDGEPVINLSNACTQNVFNGTNLLDCPHVGEDIKTCQNLGKTVILSIGGASGNTIIPNKTMAVAYADKLWYMFAAKQRANSTVLRPFGDAEVDGFDLDIEGGSSQYFVEFANRLQEKFKQHKASGGEDKYLVATPQCVYPDAWLHNVIDKVEFSWINIQFYNNYCSIDKFNDGSSSYNLNVWANFKPKAYMNLNRNQTIFVGVLGAKIIGNRAAGTGYVSPEELRDAIIDLKKNYKSVIGVTIWDISFADANIDESGNSYDERAFDFLNNRLKDVDKPIDKKGKHQPDAEIKKPSSISSKIQKLASKSTASNEEKSQFTASMGALGMQSSKIETSSLLSQSKDKKQHLQRHKSKDEISSGIVVSIPTPSIPVKESRYDGHKEEDSSIENDDISSSLKKPSMNFIEKDVSSDGNLSSSLKNKIAELVKNRIIDESSSPEQDTPFIDTENTKDKWEITTEYQIFSNVPQEIVENAKPTKMKIEDPNHSNKIEVNQNVGSCMNKGDRCVAGQWACYNDKVLQCHRFDDNGVGEIAEHKCADGLLCDMPKDSGPICQWKEGKSTPMCFSRQFKVIMDNGSFSDVVVASIKGKSAVKVPDLLNEILLKKLPDPHVPLPHADEVEVVLLECDPYTDCLESHSTSCPFNPKEKEELHPASSFEPTNADILQAKCREHCLKNDDVCVHYDCNKGDFVQNNQFNEQDVEIVVDVHVEDVPTEEMPVQGQHCELLDCKDIPEFSMQEVQTGGKGASFLQHDTIMAQPVPHNIKVDVAADVDESRGGYSEKCLKEGDRCVEMQYGCNGNKFLQCHRFNNQGVGEMSARDCPAGLTCEMKPGQGPYCEFKEKKVTPVCSTQVLGATNEGEGQLSDDPISAQPLEHSKNAYIGADVNDEKSTSGYCEECLKEGDRCVEMQYGCNGNKFLQCHRFNNQGFGEMSARDCPAGLTCEMKPGQGPYCEYKEKKVTPVCSTQVLGPSNKEESQLQNGHDPNIVQYSQHSKRTDNGSLYDYREECLNEGDPCVLGQYGCNKNMFLQCDHGKIIARQCGENTTCEMSSGQGPYCDYRYNKKTPVCSTQVLIQYSKRDHVDTNLQFMPIGKGMRSAQEEITKLKDGENPNIHVDDEAYFFTLPHPHIPFKYGNDAFQQLSNGTTMFGSNNVNNWVEASKEANDKKSRSNTSSPLNFNHKESAKDNKVKAATTKKQTEFVTSSSSQNVNSTHTIHFIIARVNSTIGIGKSWEFTFHRPDYQEFISIDHGVLTCAKSTCKISNDNNEEPVNMAIEVILISELKEGIEELDQPTLRADRLIVELPYANNLKSTVAEEEQHTGETPAEAPKYKQLMKRLFSM